MPGRTRRLPREDPERMNGVSRWTRGKEFSKRAWPVQGHRGGTLNISFQNPPVIQDETRSKGAQYEWRPASKQRPAHKRPTGVRSMSPS